MRRAKQEVVDASEIFRMLAQTARQQAIRPNIYAYEPHDKQKIFHASEKKVRLYIGGNRSGKTTGGVAEDIFYARGVHPFKKVPDVPVRGRVVSTSFLDGVAKIILPEFARWTPPSLLKNGSFEDSYDKQERVLRFANGSFIEFMSYDQDLDKFAGTSRHFVHYDEEPPRHIYNECQARLIDTDGDSWLTMTPLDGMTWIYDHLFLPGTEENDPDIEVIQVDMAENPHVGEKARKRYLATLDDDERKAREHGSFVQLGGRVYKEFSPQIHVVPSFIPPADWEWYASLDHGFNAPTAWLWHAVSPDNQVVTFSEHYASEMTVKEHASVVHARNAGFNRIPDIYVADPAIMQRQGVTGTSIQLEYIEHGIAVMPSQTRDVMTGVNRIVTYLKPNPITNKPFWTITDSCPNLIREMGRLRWKTYSSKKLQFENNPQEKIHKKDDHAADSARYFFTLLPELTPDELEPRGPEVPQSGITGRYDELLAKMVNNQQQQWETEEMYESMVD